MSADKYAQFIAEQQRKLSVSGTNTVDLHEGAKPEVSVDREGVAHVKDASGKVVASYSKKEHGADFMKKANTHMAKLKTVGRMASSLFKKEEVEQVDEKKELSPKQKKIAAQAGDPEKIEGEDFKKLRGEEVEPIDELSKKTLGSYIKQAADVSTMNAFMAGERGVRKDKHLRVAVKRLRGVKKATEKLTKEEVELISIEEQTYIEEMVGKGKLPDILMHHKDNMLHHAKMVDHHNMMADKSEQVGDTVGFDHHLSMAMSHEMDHQHHKVRYDHAAGLKARSKAQKEMKAAKDAMDAASKKIADAKAWKRDA